jgi:hypothetical protein
MELDFKLSLRLSLAQKGLIREIFKGIKTIYAWLLADQ